MKPYILILIVIFVFGFLVNWNAVDINKRPTRAQTIAIYDSLINADTLSIFDKRTAGRLESCLYTLIEIGRYSPARSQKQWRLKQDLDIHLQWLADREEQRRAMARENFNKE